MSTDTNSINDQSTLFFTVCMKVKQYMLTQLESTCMQRLQTSIHNVMHKVSYNTDTRADGNVLPTRVYQQFFPHVTQAQLEQSKKSQTCLEAFNRSKIKQLGTCKLKLHFKN